MRGELDDLALDGVVARAGAEVVGVGVRATGVVKAVRIVGAAVGVCVAAAGIGVCRRVGGAAGGLRG